MKTILFQGDSITDVDRTRDSDMYLGRGYAMLVEASLGADRPGQFRFLNRGISGNRVVDLYARIKMDIINLKPDYLSILIGVNDVWHEFGEWQNGVDTEKFYKIYSMLIEEIQEALPDIKIMILEPFVLKGPAIAHWWEDFYPEVLKRAQMAKRIADTYHLTFVPLQDMFEKALAQHPSVEYWLSDGVHPSPKGHELIKREWLKAFNTFE